MYAERAYFDVEERRRDKQRDRDLDCARLVKGEVQASDLLKKNGLFSSFRPDQMSIGQRRVRMHIE